MLVLNPEHRQAEVCCFFFPVHLLIPNKLHGNLKEETALECRQSCPMLTCWSRHPCWCGCPEIIPPQLSATGSQGSHGTSEYFMQTKIPPEIISERHGQHTVSFPWNVKHSCFTASSYELKKPQKNLKDTLEDEICNTF